MIPALCIVHVGRNRGAWLPLPIILLWPLVGLAQLVVWLSSLFAPADSAYGRSIRQSGIGLQMLYRLSGLHVDVRSARGGTVGVRFF